MKFFFLKFYWPIVDLEHCVNFCCTVQGLSYTHIYSFSCSFPLWFIPGYWIKFTPVLYGRTLLFIHPICESLHLLIPSFQSSPPSWQPQVCSLCLWVCFLAAAAPAAKLLQSCPTLCDPRDDSPPGSPVPGILQARTLEWVAISFSLQSS